MADDARRAPLPHNLLRPRLPRVEVGDVANLIEGCRIETADGVGLGREADPDQAAHQADTPASPTSASIFNSASHKGSSGDKYIAMVPLRPLPMLPATHTLHWIRNNSLIGCMPAVAGGHGKPFLEFSEYQGHDHGGFLGHPLVNAPYRHQRATSCNSVRTSRCVALCVACPQ
jgi:hypothetical protein